MSTIDRLGYHSRYFSHNIRSLIDVKLTVPNGRFRTKKEMATDGLKYRIRRDRERCAPWQEKRRFQNLYHRADISIFGKRAMD